MRTIALTFALILTGCGYWPPGDKHHNSPTPAVTITADQVSQLTAIRASTRTWAKTCKGGITCFDDSDGDSAIFAGIACLSGEQSQCQAVVASQDADGKLWRAPDRVNVDIENSSSRDMLLGGLTYIVATKDVKFATNLVKYIHSHGNTLCQDAKDNRCQFTLPTYSEGWGTIGRIWQYVGITRDADMLAGSLGENEILAFESEFSPTGYQTHLPMVEMLIRQRVGVWTQTLANAANKVVNVQNENPFFEYVAHGATATAAQLTIEQCGGPAPSEHKYWTWQEDDVKQRWSSRNGWDCIAMINFLIGP